MLRFLKLTWPMLAVLLIYAAWWKFEWPSSLPGGTANTVEELKQQISMPDFLQDLPEVGPFHWEGPGNPHSPEDAVSDTYTIRGQTKDPRVFLKWMHWEAEVTDDELNSKEVKLIAQWITTGHSISLYSDGSFLISYFKFFGRSS
ncbi:MAG: hypothetical protein R3C11_22595 [Planctomycetaceae bacterium]